jgi:hypothetical protein
MNLEPTRECTFLNTFQTRRSYAEGVGIGFVHSKCMVWRCGVLHPKDGLQALAAEVAGSVAATKLARGTGHSA